MEEKKAKPHIQYIFIDESGDLGKDGSRYFVISAISTHNAFSLSRIIKKARQKLLRKKLREVSEIKAYNSSDRMRKFIPTWVNTPQLAAI